MVKSQEQKCVKKYVILFILSLLISLLTSSASNSQGFSVSYGQCEYSGSPGESFTGVIPVVNTSDDAKSLRVYLGDWRRVEGKTSCYDFELERGLESRSSIEWTAFSPERMTLEPGERSIITYEINIPNNSELEGSYWCVIFIQGIEEEEPEMELDSEQEVAIGIRTVFRYAIQLYITIEGTEILEAAFTSMNMEPSDRGFKATAIVENRGNAIIKPEVWLELTDESGETVYNQDFGEQTVLPESARDFVFELRDLPIESGEYLVTVYADYGAPRLIAAQGRVNLTITPPEEAPPEEPEDDEPDDGGSDEPAEESD